MLIAQRVRGYAPPDWPGTAIVHLDLTAADLAAAEGGRSRLAPGCQSSGIRGGEFYSTTAGHPFCLTPFTRHSVG